MISIFHSFILSKTLPPQHHVLKMLCQCVDTPYTCCLPLPQAPLVSLIIILTIEFSNNVSVFVPTYLIHLSLSLSLSLSLPPFYILNKTLPPHHHVLNILCHVVLILLTHVWSPSFTQLYRDLLLPDSRQLNPLLQEA